MNAVLFIDPLHQLLEREVIGRGYAINQRHFHAGQARSHVIALLSSGFAPGLPLARAHA